MSDDKQRFAAQLARNLRTNDRDEIYRQIDELTGQTFSPESLEEMTELVMQDIQAYLQGWKR